MTRKIYLVNVFNSFLSLSLWKFLRVAIKKIQLNDDEKKFEQLQRNHSDLYLEDVKEINIIPYYGYFFDKSYLCIVMKYCEVSAGYFDLPGFNFLTPIELFTRKVH